MNLDSLLTDKGPVAIVLEEKLRPVEGRGAAIFPPTYAPEKGSGEKRSGYNIDRLAQGNRCTIDSVGSQANRMEAYFLQEPYSALVPHITIEAKDKKVDLLEAAHRLADAAIRFSEKEDIVRKAFQEYLAKGDATQIAKLSPTSLVFGVWDSRDTQVQVGRNLKSEIFAENVEPLTRSSQFIPTFTSENIEGKSLDEMSDKDKEKWSVAGLAHAPARGHGGVLVHGEIRRQATLNLINLKHLGAGDGTSADKLQRYILGIGLVCLTLPMDYSLRQGCLLVRDGVESIQMKVVYRDGREENIGISHQETLEFAQKAASEFGVGPALEVKFDTQKARDELKKLKDKKAG